MTDATPVAPSSPPAKKAKTKPEPGPKPDYIVIGDKLVVQTVEGELTLTLSLKTKLFREIRAKNVDEMDQFFLILDALGDKATLARIDELDIFKTTEIVARFFAEFEVMQNARLGESAGPQSN